MPSSSNSYGSSRSVLVASRLRRFGFFDPEDDEEPSVPEQVLRFPHLCFRPCAIHDDVRRLQHRLKDVQGPCEDPARSWTR